MKRLILIHAILMSALWAAEKRDSAYVLGPDDRIQVTLNELKEIEFKPVRVDGEGNIRLNYAGLIHAAGLSSEQLASEVARRLSDVVRDPKVSVDILEYGSQPVSVLGAVNKPGIYQLRGRRTLLEVLSMAEGLRTDSGHSIKITREMEYGAIPLPGAAADASGRYSTVQLSVKNVMGAGDPQSNILVRPHDVITIARAEMVYVVGHVKRPGGFVLGEKETLSVLQAISMAEGLDTAASPQNARILRSAGDSAQRTEIAINIKKILSSQEKDQPLLPNDILFVPNSASKSATLRSIEAGIQMATGIVIFRR